MTGEAILQVDVDPQDALLVVAVFRQILQPANVAEFLRVDGARVLQTRADERFASEGDAASGKWASLRFATEEIRVAKGFAPGPINRRTDEMFQYVTQNFGTTVSDAEGALMDWPSPDPTGELFTKLETAQRGKSNPKTVKRPVVAVDATDMDLLTEAFRLWFVVETEGAHSVVL